MIMHLMYRQFKGRPADAYVYPGAGVANKVRRAYIGREQGRADLTNARLWLK